MNRSRIVRWGLLAIAGLAPGNTSNAASPHSEQPIAFVHVNVVPIDRDRVLRDQTVIVNTATSSSRAVKNAQRECCTPAQARTLAPT